MSQTTKRRPKYESGFLRLKKDSLKQLDDRCTPAACYIAVKLLAAATYGNGMRGYLGFWENPWTMRDIAACINVSVSSLSEAIERLTAIQFMRYEDTGAKTRRGGIVGIWHIIAYDLFVPPNRSDGEQSA